MLLLRTGALLALLCLLSAGQVVQQHPGHVHAVPHHELRRVLPHAVPHRLRAGQGKREQPVNKNTLKVGGAKLELNTSGFIKHDGV